MDIYLDLAVLGSRAAPRCNEFLRLAKAKIRRKLRGRRGRERQLGATSMSMKDRRTKDSIDRLQKEVETTQRANHNPHVKILLDDGQSRSGENDGIIIST